MPLKEGEYQRKSTTPFVLVVPPPKSANLTLKHYDLYCCTTIIHFKKEIHVMLMHSFTLFSSIHCNGPLYKSAISNEAAQKLLVGTHANPTFTLFDTYRIRTCSLQDKAKYSPQETRMTTVGASPV